MATRQPTTQGGGTVSQRFGRGGTRPTPDDEQREDSNGREPGHPFFGMSEAEIQRRVGDRTRDEQAAEPTQEDGADAEVTWRECWADVNAVVSDGTCEVLSGTQVRLLADIHGLPEPTQQSPGEALDAVVSECGRFRGFVLAGKTPVLEVPEVSDTVKASRLWSSDGADRSDDSEDATEDDTNDDSDGGRVNSNEVLRHG